MSSNLRHSQPEPVDAIAAKWIGRLDAGITSEEEAELQRWRAADRRHEEAFAHFQAVLFALGRPRRTAAARELTRELHVLTRNQRRRRFAAAGASLAVLLAIGVSWWAQRAPFSTPRVVLLVPERHALPDGSTIEHPSGTEFSIDYSGPLRRVVLRKGEGLFQVAKDPERPFVVEAAGVEIFALGTAFSVQVGPEAVDVLVTEGTVRVEPRRAPTMADTFASTPRSAADSFSELSEERPPSRLEPLRPRPRRPSSAISPSGDRPSEAGETRSHSYPIPAPEPVVLTVGQKTIVPLSPTGASGAVTAVDTEAVAERLAWRNPRVEFSGARFSEVVAVMNQYNRVRFVIADPTLDRVQMSGLFRADDPETFVRMLESGFGVKAEARSAGEILLHKAR